VNACRRGERVGIMENNLLNELRGVEKTLPAKVYARGEGIWTVKK
jgi:hypothetical protein